MKMKCLTFSVLMVQLATISAYIPWAGNVVLEPQPYVCSNLITKEIVLDFRLALYTTTETLFRKFAEITNGHFVLSPFTIWKALAAIAEGTTGPTRNELFRFLNLPEDICIRQIYYHLAATRELPTEDVVLDRKVFFIADSSVLLNSYWETCVKAQKLLNVARIPYKNNPAEVENWKNIFNLQLPSIDLSGNSLILGSLDYHGLWNSAFSKTIVTEPFYNDLGEAIASMEFMKLKKRVNVAYLPNLNMKMLELPVGKDSRYRMLFGMNLKQGDYKSTVNRIPKNIILDSVRNFKRSKVPIEVSVPRLAMTSEIDVRKVIEEIGIRGMWTDPYATRNISEPAALPSSYIQRVTVTLSNSGVRPTVHEYTNFIPPASAATNSPFNGTGLDPAVGTDFIVNRPFIFGLFDSETLTCLFAAAFSKPEY